MNACPNCGSALPYRALVLAPLPAWPVCPHCKNRLQGGALVMALSIAESLLVVGLLMAEGLTVHFSLQSFADPNLYHVAVVVATLAALLVITWLTVPMLALRYGRFSAGTGDREHRVLSNYLKTTTFVAVALAVWIAVSVSVHPTGLLLLASWTLAPPLLYAAIARRRGRRPGIAAALLLLVWAATFNVLGATLNVYAFANYPEEQPFEERLRPSRAFGSERGAWRLLQTLTDDLKTGREPTAQERGNILALVAQTVVSPPREALSVAGGIPRFQAIADMSDAELAEIRGLLSSGDEAAARARYMRLWAVADNLISSRGVLIQYLVGMEIASDLVEFHLEGDNPARLAGGARLKLVAESVHDKLDAAFVGAITHEYFTLKNTLVEFPREVCQAVPRGLCIMEWPWPVFDINKTFRIEHSLFSRLADLAGDPYYRIESDLAAYRAESVRSNGVSLLRNPVGTVVLSLRIPGWLARFILPKETTKARVSAFQYVLESLESGDFGEAPIDPLTGERFTVTEDGATVTIRSAYMDAGGPVLRYEVARGR